MSTRSYIAKQIGDDQYRTIFCRFDGYLTYIGALLLDYYNSPEKVDELLALGDIYILKEKLSPDPNKPHDYETDQLQDDVTVAFARDCGVQDTQSKVMTRAQLEDMDDNWIEYVYIFTRENEWKYFPSMESEEWLGDVKEDLDAEYASYGITRPEGYYGIVTKSLIENAQKEQVAEEQDVSSPMLTM